jgi:hypothetical protein
MPLAPGSIAFTGNTASFTSFVVLEAIAAGTEIKFTNSYVSIGDTSGGTWTWTAGGDIAAGTVVTLDNWLPANVGDPVSATSNHGTVAYQGPEVPSVSGMWLIAYTGEASSATYLTAIVSTGSSDPSIYLTGTGLTFGVDAVSLAYNPQGTAIIGTYTGPTSGFATFEDYQAALFNAANWAQQAFSAGDPRYDDVGPDLPFPTTPFTSDPAVQTVGFETLFVSATEGEEGESQTLTFTISRSGGTAGDLSFSGSLVLGSGVDAADFGGSLPTFSGVIPDGAELVTVTIQVVGDIKYEADETFQIKIDNVSNASSAANVGGAGAATVTIVNDDAPQTVGFAAESQSVTVIEGNDGTQLLTFTVVRSGSTLGDLAFDVQVQLSGGNVNADDFGGMLPTMINGVIPAGQTSATFTIQLSGDTRVESNERIALIITSVSNEPVGAVVDQGASLAFLNITNDDAVSLTIPTGTISEAPITLTGNGVALIEAGALLETRSAAGITWSGAASAATIDNYGRIDEVTNGNAITVASSARGTLLIHNHAGAEIGATVDLSSVRNGAVATVENEGLIQGGLGNNAMRMSTQGMTVINNRATGVISTDAAGSPVMRNGSNVTVNNWGDIVSAADTESQNGGDAINFSSGVGNVVHNYAGGLIEGSRHALTGSRAITVINEADGAMIGRNGSAVNIDNDASSSNRVRITNYGVMEGRSANTSDSDGDAIDIDGLLELDNYGTVRGAGHSGLKDGEPNVSEGIAVGGGIIRNHEGGVISGFGRAIQFDDSSNAGALGVATVTNAGLIHGEGNLPAGPGVTPEHVALFAERMRGGEAINIVGSFGDTLTNTATGQIIGGVKMGGGEDTLTNSGVMTATGGSAIDMGEGDDVVTLAGGSVVTGAILLGEGDDRLTGAASAETVDGGAGEDRIDSGGGDDVVVGGAGDDLLIAGAGNDIIDGGADDDVIYGDAGNDTLTGGFGNDVIKGGADNDTFVIEATGDGRDSYDGGSCIDTLDHSALDTAVSLTLKDGVTTYQTDLIENIENVIGGSAGDKLTGNALDNVLTGNAGDDTLKGGAGNDTLDGGEGIDTLDGGVGSDALLGGAGDDVLKGGAGNDVIAGGAGNDTLTGGAGFDTVVFDSLSDGIDTITDFRVSGASMDQLQFSASLFQNFSGDDAFDLIGGGFLRAVSGGGQTQLQIDLDGGGDAFQTLAILGGSFSNGILADHTIVVQDPIV